MTYETFAFFSHMTALVLFGGVMLGMVIYAFWPANKARFERAAQLALENNMDCGEGGKHGRS